MAVIVDTNVAVVANGQSPQASPMSLYHKTLNPAALIMYNSH